MVTKKALNLLKGHPSPSLLPIASIYRATQAALDDPQIAVQALTYGPDAGFAPLRDEIARWMRRFYGSYSHSDSSQDPTENPRQVSDEIPRQVMGSGELEEKVASGAERIAITGGASQNLACVLQVYSDPVRTKVWMVAPCYFLACRIFGDAGLQMGAVPEGEEGVDSGVLEELLERDQRERGDVEPVKVVNPWGKFYKNIIYCVPTFSNPSGKTMTLANRQSLVRLARKYDALIITDDVYDFLQFPTNDLTSFADLSHALMPRLVDVDQSLPYLPSENDDGFGNAVSNASFSKIAGPGVRTGWAVATAKFTYGLSQVGSSRSGGAPSQLAATIMYELLRTGDMEHHIQRILKPSYQKRYEIMMEAIKTHLFPLGVRVGEVSFGDKAVFGGYFIWLELPKKVGADEVTRRAKEMENLVVAPGSIFEVVRDSSVRFENSLRLCFAWEDEGGLREGVVRLGRVVKSVLEGKEWRCDPNFGLLGFSGTKY